MIIIPNMLWAQLTRQHCSAETTEQWNHVYERPSDKAWNRILTEQGLWTSHTCGYQFSEGQNRKRNTINYEPLIVYKERKKNSSLGKTNSLFALRSNFSPSIGEYATRQRYYVMKAHFSKFSQKKLSCTSNLHLSECHLHEARVSAA